MGYLKKAASFLGAYLPALLAMGVLVVMGEMASAQTPDLIPDVGFDVGDYITEGIEKLATVVAVCVGGWFMFRIVRVGLSWARTVR